MFLSHPHCKSSQLLSVTSVEILAKFWAFQPQWAWFTSSFFYFYCCLMLTVCQTDEGEAEEQGYDHVLWQ